MLCNEAYFKTLSRLEYLLVRLAHILPVKYYILFDYIDLFRNLSVSYRPFCYDMLGTI